MDLLIETFAEYNIEVDIFLRLGERIYFNWAERQFVAGQENGSFSLEELVPDSQGPPVVIEEKAGMIDIARKLLSFAEEAFEGDLNEDEPKGRQDIADILSNHIGLLGATHGWSGSEPLTEGLEWGYEGLSFWGFEFRVCGRLFRIIYTKDTEEFSLLERIFIENGEDEEFGAEMVEYLTTEDIVEIQQYIQSIMF